MAIINDRTVELLQLRIQHEEANSKAYSAMSSWLNLHGYKGAAKLWSEYSKEELIHRDWAVKYLLDLNILPIESSQEEPKVEFKGLSQIIALSYQREIKTTEEVTYLSKECLRIQDMMTFTLAQRYVEEQINEIAKIQFWIDRLDYFGDDKIALRMLDSEMGSL